MVEGKGIQNMLQELKIQLDVFRSSKFRKTDKAEMSLNLRLLSFDQASVNTAEVT
jgi:hypothetical protein